MSLVGKYEISIQKEDIGLIRIRTQSRHKSSKTYFLFIYLFFFFRFFIMLLDGTAFVYLVQERLAVVPIYHQCFGISGISNTV